MEQVVSIDQDITIGAVDMRGYNGTTWDNWRNNSPAVELLASATRSATTSCATQTNYNHRGVFLALIISARTVGASPLIRVVIRFAAGGAIRWYAKSADFDPTTICHWMVLYPGVSAAVTGSYPPETRLIESLPLPRSWDVYVQHVSNVTDLTYSLEAYLIV